ncbi:MAG: hypothetical protein ACJ76N_25930 [Thermoanaerobaculia bacterium]
MIETPYAPAPPGPMPFRLLLDEALRQARRNFRAIYPAVAVPVAIVSSAMAALQAVWFSRMTLDLSTPNAGFLSPGYFLVLLFQIALFVVAGNALQVGALDAANGRPVDMGRAWRFSLQGRVLVTLVLSLVLSLAAFFCCCLPALVVVPMLSLVPAVMVEEGSFFVQALSRSIDLTTYRPHGRWQEMALFRVLLVIFVGLLLAYLVGILVSLPFQVPMYIDLFRHAAAGEDMVRRMSSWIWLQVPAQFLNALATQAVSVYTSFCIALLFHDARGRKEGTDLRQEIDSMFAPPPPYSGEPAP